VLNEALETNEDEPIAGEGQAVPPARRGSRDARRDATLRAFTAGRDAFCAYCGHQLPPIPARGGRPTPYCPADPDRYGRWGAKVITCAMLDECREIWVRTYGRDQPMTQVDIRTLDERAATLLAALGPLREELAALRTRVADETAAALAAKAHADQAQAHAETQAREAAAERAEALDEAEQARQQAEEDRAELRSARELAARAVEDKTQAVAQQQAAENEKNKAVADRERALDQLTAAQERIGEIQNALAAERATALERLDRLRHEEDQARQNLRTALTEEFDERMRARADEYDEQARSLRTAADQRVTELHSQLTQATQTYADSLAPLHAQLGQLRNEVVEQTATASALRQQLDDLRAALTDAVDETTTDEPLHQRVADLLGQHRPLNCQT
jgi:chromosome segregation ATPase